MSAYVRTYDLDVPVVLITGSPSLDTALKAIEHGALRYLAKPVELEALVQVADDAVRLHRIARARRQAIELAGGVERLVRSIVGSTVSSSRATLRHGRLAVFRSAVDRRDTRGAREMLRPSVGRICGRRARNSRREHLKALDNRTHVLNE